MSDLTVATPEVTALTTAKYADDKAFDNLSSESFLPRLQLMGSNSDQVKEGKIGIGRWSLIKTKEDFVDLGAETNILVLGWRPKAMDTKNREDVHAFYNPQSAEFKECMEKSNISDSGCFYGPEYLIWLCNEKKWCVLLMGSKTARREAPLVKALLAAKVVDGQFVVEKKFGTLKCKLIKTSRHSWHGPVVTQCSQSYDLPEMSEIVDQLTKFNNPPDEEVELAEQPGASTRET